MLIHLFHPLNISFMQTFIRLLIFPSKLSITSIKDIFFLNGYPLAFPCSGSGSRRSSQLGDRHTTNRDEENYGSMFPGKFKRLLTSNSGVCFHVFSHVLQPLFLSQSVADGTFSSVLVSLCSLGFGSLPCPFGGFCIPFHVLY